MRVRVQGRTVRYEAGLDICLLALQILREFRDDEKQGRFMGVHDDIRPSLLARIAEGEALEQDTGTDLDDWKDWLHRVADELPGLWD